MYPRMERFSIAVLIILSARALERPKETMHASSSCSTSGGGEDRARWDAGGKLGEGEGGVESKVSELRFTPRFEAKGTEGRSEIALICCVKSVVIKGVTIVTMAVSGSIVDFEEFMSVLADRPPRPRVLGGSDGTNPH